MEMESPSPRDDLATLCKDVAQQASEPKAETEAEQPKEQEEHEEQEQEQAEPEPIVNPFEGGQETEHGGVHRHVKVHTAFKPSVAGQLALEVG
eukprot:COSAG04_NODE_7326_length_1147_cov_0.873092_3_plen_92_part_01